MLIEFLHDFLNLILGLFLLRMIQLKLNDDSSADKAVAFLIH